jgi:predicted nucleotidyltransferase
MNGHEVESSPHQIIMIRFVAACQADERIVAATLYGSHASNAADAYSDLDLGLITTDAAHDEFVAERQDFIQKLGNPVFVEDFDIPGIVFVIFSDGVELELRLGRESRLDQDYEGPYQVLLDKRHILSEVVPLRNTSDPAEQVEALRRLVAWFWHDFSHFLTAIARRQLWWAQGQLHVLRLICLNLARLRNNFMDPYVDDEGYFKVDQVLSLAQLSPLESTFCPLELEAMLDAAGVILHFYRDLAQPLAQEHGIPYPADLDLQFAGRLTVLQTAHLD